MNFLKIIYTARERKGYSETRWFKGILIDIEELWIENPDFTKIDRNSQLEVIKSYIKKDRVRFNSKEFFEIKWMLVENKDEVLD